jgi:uncharacterized protein (DUF2342 family)
MHITTTLAVSLLPLLALAKTDLSGCTSSVAGPKLVWYVPDTGELCDFLDCGGGRAPPKTTVPGCPGYEGTETYKPSFLPGFGEGAKATSAAASSVAAVTTSAGVTSASAASASATKSGSVAPASSAVESASFSTITTPATLPLGTGTLPSGTTLAGGNNLTATASLSSTASAPANTGAAGMVAVNGVLGVVMGVLGLAVL